MKNRRFLSFLLIAVMLCTVLVAGCAKTPAEAPPPANTEPAQPAPGDATEPAPSGDVPVIKIGAIYALTGPSASTGKDQQSAINLGIDIVNGSYPDVPMPFAETEGIPSMNGAKIEIIFANSEGDPEKGASEAERLIEQEGVCMLMGCYQSGVVAAASQVAERKGIPFFIVESSSPTLTSRGFKYLFRQGAHDAMIVESIFDFLDSIREEKNLNTISMLYDSSTYGMDAAKAWQDNADRRGYQVLESLSYPTNTTNMSSEVQRIKASAPDIMMGASFVSESVLTMNTLKEQGYMPNLVTNNSGYTDNQYITMLGADAEYTISRLLYCSDTAENNPRAAVIEKMFNERTGIANMNDNTARAVQSAFVIADVLNRAGSTDPEAIRKAFTETNIPGDDLIVPWTQISFNAEGQNEYARALVCQIQGGKYVTVWPEAFASAELIWPIPQWSER